MFKHYSNKQLTRTARIQANIHKRRKMIEGTPIGQVHNLAHAYKQMDKRASELNRVMGWNR